MKTESFNNTTDFEKTSIEEENTLSAENLSTQTTVETLVDDNIDYKDNYIRLYAEFENYKKRIQKEKQDLIVKTKVDSINSVLDLYNDLHFAKKLISDSEGIDIIINKFSNFLKSQGVEEIQTEVYDSDIHEVISVLETGENKIIDVVSKGYMINGKPFRYPKIILGK
jgi:molecular chaperone GrpE